MDRTNGLAFGSVVLSASPRGELGGDVVDVFALDDRFELIVVADVSGKGAEAAAQAAFIRYTVRTLAIEGDGDPAVVMAKFNAIFCRTIENYEAFVVLIIGIVDSQTGEVRYASAGHEPAFLRRGGCVAMLPPTGPIVGASPFSAYRTESFSLESEDMLVWATDGFTESRNASRELLGAQGLAAWVAGGPSDVRQMADMLIAALTLRSGRCMNDDVAVLAVSFAGTPAITTSRPSAVRERSVVLTR